MPQQTDRTIYVGSVGKEVDEPALLALFGHCGTVSHLQPEPTDYRIIPLRRF